MADLTLKLGDFVFKNSEIPAAIPFGGEQMLSTRTMVGGARKVDAMGPSDTMIRWGGLFRGQEATRRARYLDGLRRAGKPLKLTWHEFSYLVLIRTFLPIEHRYYEISYTIGCVVVSDLTKPIKMVARHGILAQIEADLNDINTLVSLIVDNPLTQAVGQFAAAVSLLPGGSRISRSLQQQLLYPLQSAQQRTSVLIGSTNSVLEAGGAIYDATSLTAQASSMSQMSNLLSLSGLLGRMSNNIGAATGGTNSVTIAGGNLFDLAAKQYGDPAQWTTIASANNMPDPMIIGPQTLQIPGLPDSSGGVLKF